MLKSEDKTNNVYIRTGEFSFLREFRDMAAVQEWQDWINTYVSLNPGFPTATFETADI
jgi:hypothetical protein